MSQTEVQLLSEPPTTMWGPSTSCPRPPRSCWRAGLGADALGTATLCRPGGRWLPRCVALPDALTPRTGPAPRGRTRLIHAASCLPSALPAPRMSPGSPRCHGADPGPLPSWKGVCSSCDGGRQEVASLGCSRRECEAGVSAGRALSGRPEGRPAEACGGVRGAWDPRLVDATLLPASVYTGVCTPCPPTAAPPDDRVPIARVHQDATPRGRQPSLHTGWSPSSPPGPYLPCGPRGCDFNTFCLIFARDKGFGRNTHCPSLSGGGAASLKECPAPPGVCRHDPPRDAHRRGLFSL